MKRVIVQCSADEVTEGDFLSDLDNGYVYDAVPYSDYYTKISWHDAEGEENYMVVSNTLQMRVQEGEAIR